MSIERPQRRRNREPANTFGLNCAYEEKEKVCFFFDPFLGGLSRNFEGGEYRETKPLYKGARIKIISDRGKEIKEGLSIERPST